MKKPYVAEDLIIGGFTPLTTIDYPDALSAVIFLQGCPWRCGYCQNADLLPRKAHHRVSWQSIIERLQRRQGLLDAVVFSGGEPTLQPALLPAIDDIKSMGFKIGLHSAGIYPHRLEKLLPKIDWIGLDIKARRNDYATITGVAGSGQRAWDSARQVISSGIDYEIRTTVHSELMSADQLAMLAEELKLLGAENYVIQQCISKHCLDDGLSNIAQQSLDPLFMANIKDHFEQFCFR